MLAANKITKNQQGELADYLPWSFLSAEGVVEHKDGTLQKTWRFCGPDLDSATKRELMSVSGSFNNALRRLADGWAIFIEAQRNPINEYPTSTWPNEASQAIDDERRSYFEKGHNFFINEYFLTM